MSATPVLTFFKSLLPERFGTRVTLLAIGLITVTTVLIAFLVERQGINMLLEEKQAKLFAIGHILDLELGDAFDARDDVTSRQEQITRLNQRLSSRTEALLSDIPKVGAGYYNKALDAIIVYAPEAESGATVGLSIAPEHPGRVVMATGQPMVQTGRQVRGNIMNAMRPILRDGEVKGYIWSNELVDDISRQTRVLDRNVLAICFAGLLVSVFLTSLLSRRLNKDIGIIKQGLQHLPFDLHYKIAPMRGEINEIAEGVNHLATELSDAKTLNELILESTVDGVLTVDNNAVITMLNPAAQRMTGLTLEQAVGRPYREILDDPQYESPLLDTLYNGNDHVGVEKDFPVAGKVYRISSSTNHLRNRNGQIIGAVVIFKDMTDQKRMQQLISQAERLAAMGELMAGVAHEIRNPLTAVKGFVQYLRQEDIPAEERAEYISVVLKEVDSINRVIQQLLDLSRPPRNCFTMVSLNQLVRDALALVRSAQPSASSIRFDLELDESLGDICIDREMIKQVLLNLFINAVQAVNAATGHITITTRSAADIAQQTVEITDNGPGISAQVQQKLFTPFFTTKPTGTGLGLAMAQKIVASHNGSISINNAPQGGTVVVMMLPVS